jgi:hypothetical protein
MRQERNITSSEHLARRGREGANICEWPLKYHRMASHSSTTDHKDAGKPSRSRSASPDAKSRSASPRTQKADARSPRDKSASETPWYVVEAFFRDIKPVKSTVDAAFYAIPMPKTVTVKTFKTKEQCDAHIRLIASGAGCKTADLSGSFHNLTDEEKFRHLLHVIATTGTSLFGEYLYYPVNRDCGMIEEGKVGPFAVARFCGYQPPIDAKPDMDSLMIDRVQFFSTLKAATDAASEYALTELRRLAEELGETDEDGKVLVNPFGPFSSCLKDDGTISILECEKFGGVSTVARELGWMYWQVAIVEESTIVSIVSEASVSSATAATAAD